MKQLYQSNRPRSNLPTPLPPPSPLPQEDKIPTVTSRVPIPSATTGHQTKSFGQEPFASVSFCVERFLRKQKIRGRGQKSLSAAKRAIRRIRQKDRVSWWRWRSSHHLNRRCIVSYRYRLYISVDYLLAAARCGLRGTGAQAGQGDTRFNASSQRPKQYLLPSRGELYL